MKKVQVIIFYWFLLTLPLKNRAQSLAAHVNPIEGINQIDLSFDAADMTSEIAWVSENRTILEEENRLSDIAKRRQLTVNPIRADEGFCWRTSYGRGVGVIPTYCKANEENQAGLCYKKCRSGYAGAGPVCWQKCPRGWRDDGAFCAKPSSYGRGTGYGYFWPFENRGHAKRRCESKHGRKKCQRWGEMYYKKCKSGYHNVGCCVCSPNCQNGMHDIGVSCTKGSYTRGAGTIPQNCASNYENDAGLCYPKCNSGYSGAGPYCWASTCPVSKPIACGSLGCTTSAEECNLTIMELSYLTFETGFSLALFAGRGAKLAKRAKLKMKGITPKTKIFLDIDTHGKKVLQSGRKIRLVEEVQDLEKTHEWDWSKLDPTGIAQLVQAYSKPICH